MMEAFDDQNSDFELAYRIVEHTGMHLFLTGRAGTGKTTFLRRLIEKSTKRIVVSAPTGIAAVNAGGVTLHSLFQLDFGPFIPGVIKKSGIKFRGEKLKVVRNMDILVIDEISMVRADLLDSVDDALRRLRKREEPFGGVQLLLIGDLRQLPPVTIEKEWSLLKEHYATPYFFSSHALANCQYVTIELQKVYRQEEKSFLELLNAIRDGKPSASVLEKLNRRYKPDFKSDGQTWIQLTTHNNSAANINAEYMRALDSSPVIFSAETSGDFPESAYPAEEKLLLKEGAQVMFIKNDIGQDKRFYNGMLGVIKSINYSENKVVVTASNGSGDIEVVPMEWSNCKYVLNEENGELEEEIVGQFKQIPLRAAWAITIHKSQGLTFDHVIIDAAGAFAHGQTYVALSRCRTYNGMVLSSKLPASSIINDFTVSRFLEGNTKNRPNEQQLQNMEKYYSISLLDSLFSFKELRSVFDDLRIVLSSSFILIYPKLISKFEAQKSHIIEKMEIPGTKFRSQYGRLIIDEASGNSLTDRLRAAANYYLPLLAELRRVVGDVPDDFDNKATKDRVNGYVDVLLNIIAEKRSQFQALREKAFTPSILLRARTMALPSINSKKKSKQIAHTIDKATLAESTDFEGNKDVYNAIKMWRRAKALEQGVSQFSILPLKAISELSKTLPRNRREFISTPWCGKKRAELYSEEICNLIDEVLADDNLFS